MLDQGWIPSFCTAWSWACSPHRASDSQDIKWTQWHHHLGGFVRTKLTEMKYVKHLMQCPANGGCPWNSSDSCYFCRQGQGILREIFLNEVCVLMYFINYDQVPTTCRESNRSPCPLGASRLIRDTNKILHNFNIISPFGEGIQEEHRGQDRMPEKACWRSEIKAENWNVSRCWWHREQAWRSWERRVF